MWRVIRILLSQIMAVVKRLLLLQLQLLQLLLLLIVRAIPAIVRVRQKLLWPLRSTKLLIGIFAAAGPKVSTWRALRIQLQRLWILPIGS